MTPRRPTSSATPSAQSLPTFQQHSLSCSQGHEDTSCSLPSSPRARRQRNVPSNPELRQIHVEAKQQAIQEYEQEQALKQAIGTAPRKQISKRKLSNIKSALVCRSAATIYIEKLESKIVTKEREQLRLIRNMSALNEQTCALEEKIQRLEAKQAAANSWLNNANAHGSSLVDHPDAEMIDLHAPANFESAFGDVMRQRQEDLLVLEVMDFNTRDLGSTDIDHSGSEESEVEEQEVFRELNAPMMVSGPRDFQLLYFGFESLGL